MKLRLQRNLPLPMFSAADRFGILVDMPDHGKESRGLLHLAFAEWRDLARFCEIETQSLGHLWEHW